MRLIFAVLAFGLLTASAFAASPGTSGAHKLGWKLTLQSWTLQSWSSPTNQRTVVQSLEVAKKLGLHYIEIFPGQALTEPDGAKWGVEMTDHQIHEMLDAAKAADVKIIDTGVIDIPMEESRARKLFQWAKKLGITEIVSEPNPRALPMIDRLAGEYKIKVAIHDHPKGHSIYWNPDDTYEKIKNLPHVGFCADVGHWKRSGFEPSLVLEKYADKVYSLHFKDLVPNSAPPRNFEYGDVREWHDVPWGSGESRAADMLRILKEKGFRGPIAIEYESPWQMKTLHECVDWFNAEADKLAR